MKLIIVHPTDEETNRQHIEPLKREICGATHFCLCYQDFVLYITYMYYNTKCHGL